MHINNGSERSLLPLYGRATVRMRRALDGDLGSVEAEHARAVGANSAHQRARRPSGLFQQDLSLQAVGIPKEHAQRPAEVVNRAVARPCGHQPVPDRVERFA
jgi:hypothetical protein